MSDAINPDHYKRLPSEAIEIIEAAIDNAPSNQDAYLHGQVLKYILRCWNKNGIEDLRKAKWYLDRLVDSLDEYEHQKAADLQSLKDHPFGKIKQPAWTPQIGDWVRIKKTENAFGWIEGMMDEHDGKVVLVSEIEDRSIVHEGWYFSFDWLEPAEQPKAPLNSDTIPVGYRKLNDSSEEPRQLGDLRWSVAEKRYIEISGDEIGYANRDNWAACRKIEPAIKQPSTTEPPDGWRANDNVSLAVQMAANSFGGKDGVFNAANFSNAIRQLAGVGCTLDGHVIATILGGRSDVEVLEGGSHYRYLFYKSINSSQELVEPPKQQTPTEPPNGWRFLEVGEVIRKGDKYRDLKSQTWIEVVGAVGDSLQDFHKPTIRRNRFEVGEKVVHGDCKSLSISVVENILGDGWVDLVRDGVSTAYHVKDLAPYIEDAT